MCELRLEEGAEWTGLACVCVKYECVLQRVCVRVHTIDTSTIDTETPRPSLSLSRSFSLVLSLSLSFTLSLFSLPASLSSFLPPPPILCLSCSPPPSQPCALSHTNTQKEDHPLDVLESLNKSALSIIQQCHRIAPCLWREELVYKRRVRQHRERVHRVIRTRFLAGRTFRDA